MVASLAIGKIWPFSAEPGLAPAMPAYRI